MTYEVEILPRAQRRLERIEERAFRGILAAIQVLSMTPRPPGCRKLTDRDGWQFRIGDYRAIYVIDDAQQKITVAEDHCH